MAGRGPAPKPADQRRNFTKPTRGEWVDLPTTGRPGKAPALPTWRKWTKAARDEWARIWAKPEATMWDERDADLVRWLVLFEAFIEEPRASVSAEMRQIEDRHGMNEKGRRDLRWRYTTAAEPSTTAKRSGTVIRPERWQQP